jgi:hypothetical protein
MGRSSGLADMSLQGGILKICQSDQNDPSRGQCCGASAICFRSGSVVYKVSAPAPTTVIEKNSLTSFIDKSYTFW